MFRFTIREIVLLTAIAALTLGWALDRSYLADKLETTRSQNEYRLETLESIQEQLHRRGMSWWRPSPKDDVSISDLPGQDSESHH